MPFEIRGFSLPLVVFSIGVVLTGSSFAGFFLNDGGGDGAISSLGFVYGKWHIPLSKSTIINRFQSLCAGCSFPPGIPIFLIGLSLWYAEIPPVLVSAIKLYNSPTSCYSLV